MQQKILITGVSGFAGSHLAEYLISKQQYSIFGTYLQEESLINVSEIEKKIQLTKIDLTRGDDVSSLIKQAKPDFVFHLAAATSPAESFTNPGATITNNAMAQIHLLEAIRKEKLLDTKILIISSADVYGKVAKNDLPIDENTPFMPVDPYAVSKITQDYLGLQYFLSYQLKIVRARPFNHTGPRQSPQFVVSSFAKKIASIEKGEIEPVLKVGNLDAKRDFTDVRDMVQAYALLLGKGKIGDVYNIGSGVSYSISEILQKLLSFSKKEITIEKDPLLMRPGDAPNLVCDNRKISDEIGWKPMISLDTTLEDTLDYWRNFQYNKKI